MMGTLLTITIATMAVAMATPTTTDYLCERAHYSSPTATAIVAVVIGIIDSIIPLTATTIAVVVGVDAALFSSTCSLALPTPSLARSLSNSACDASPRCTVVLHHLVCAITIVACCLVALCRHFHIAHSFRTLFLF